MTAAVRNSPCQIFTAINSSDKKNYVLQNPIQAYPVMKFQLLTQLNHWCRETTIQEGVKVETRLNWIEMDKSE